MVKSTKTQYYNALSNYEKALTKTIKERTKEKREERKLENTQLKTKKYEESLKEKSQKKWSKLAKKLSKPMTQKKVLKENKTTLTIKDYKAESAWDEPSIFFKGQMEAEKKSLFFK
jgi:septal ring factor EnvC (AmiA/AmiB activator)